MSETGEPDLVLHDDLGGGVRRVLLNRPQKRNAILMPDMLDALAAAITAAHDDDAVKVILIAGAGDHFCAGDDVSRVPIDAASKPAGRIPQSVRIRNSSRMEQRIDELVLNSDKTTICACQGAVLGLGFRLAMCCDLIVAADDAYFGRPQSRLGLAGLDLVLPVTLLRLGINRGYEAIITGRRISAAELHQWGVASSVVERGRLEEESLRYARAVAAHSADGLMIGRQAMRMFWAMMGLGQWAAFRNVAYPLFTNLVWREDEANFLKERRDHASAREALDSVYERWRSLGFD